LSSGGYVFIYTYLFIHKYINIYIHIHKYINIGFLHTSEIKLLLQYIDIEMDIKRWLCPNLVSIFICAYMYVYMCVCMYLYRYMYVYMCEYMNMCIYVYIYI
jgi:hypothetical protein